MCSHTRLPEKQKYPSPVIREPDPADHLPPCPSRCVPARFQLTSMCLAGQLAAHARSEQHVCCLASWLLLLLPADVGLLPLVGMAICCFFFLHSAANLQVTRGNFVSLGLPDTFKSNSREGKNDSVTVGYFFRNQDKNAGVKGLVEILFPSPTNSLMLENIPPLPFPYSPVCYKF